MQYRCPLCLKLLERQDVVRKFCPIHPDANAEPVDVYKPDKHHRGFLCSVSECDRHTRIKPDGLMLRHEGCRLEVPSGALQPAWNPFWDGTSLKFVDRVTVRQQGQDISVQPSHWQLHALRQAARAGGHEMWFPSTLLQHADSGRHVMVSLTGAKAVGKTYLALRAMDPATYRTIPKPVDDYFYVHPGAIMGSASTGSEAEFLGTLYLRQLLFQARHALFEEALASTAFRPRNLKTAFFLADADDHPAQKKPQERMERAKSGMRAFWDTVRSRLTPDGDTPDDSYRALMFYDLAGEHVEEDGIEVARHDEAMDVVAVLVSADDLASGGGSVQTARARLGRIAGQRKKGHPRCCLIVTKCDMAGEGMTPNGSVPDALRERVNETFDLPPGRRGQKVVDKVFYTWRTGIGTPQDRLHGLEEFVGWCLR